MAEKEKLNTKLKFRGPRITFECEDHGIQKFAGISGHAQITLWCGCTWVSTGSSDKGDKLQYRGRYRGRDLKFLTVD